jgi:uncharacterized protein (DUF1697 family)
MPEKRNPYISMLRGINVSGQKIIRMEELASLYESLGFKNVRTYVQSGNVLFDSPLTDGTKLTRLIADRIKPFLKERGIDPARLYVTFLSEVPDLEALNLLRTVKDEHDEFRIAPKKVYLHCPDGYGRTKLSNNFFEKTLKVAATTRNWNTVKALLGMAGG